MITYTLKVIAIKKETADTVTLCFKQPGLKKIKYQAGQYLTLIFRINGRRYIRPYSFSSAPSTDSTLEVTVKRIPNGIVSNHIHDVVQIGDSIEVMPPMGDFIFDKNKIISDQVFLWGVGSGITPLISLAKQILSEEPGVSVNLIYGNRNHESTIFWKLLIELSEKYKEKFRVSHFHTQMLLIEGPPQIIEGRITKQDVSTILNNVNTTGSLHYICGPRGLKESVKEALFFQGVAEDHILSEEFELTKDPKDFEEIQTQAVKLLFSGQEYKLEVTKGVSILESALNAGIELPYSCQTGNCSTCKAKVKSGSLKMIGLNHVREDLLADEYLLCCSHPLTNNVCIEF